MLSRSAQRLLIIVLAASGTIILLAKIIGPRTKHTPQTVSMPVQQEFTIAQANHAISRGAIITDGDVELKMTVTAPEPGTIRLLADARERVALRDISVHEPLTVVNTMAMSTSVRLARIIPEGLRAVALRISDDTAVANLIRPGDHVDVLIVSNARGGQGSAESAFPDAEARTVLQDVEVLAVGDLVIGGHDKDQNYRNVTLAVTPKQAAMVALTRSVGTQFLALRASDDRGGSEAGASLTTQDLHLRQGEHIAEAGVVPGPFGRSVEIIAGSKRSVALVPLEAGR